MARIAIISTMGAVPWGGSEYLWAAMAEQALLEGHEVFISIYDWSIHHPLIAQLQQHGAQLLPRPRLTSLPSRILMKIKAKFSILEYLPFKSSYQAIFDCKPDIICISQGNAYDFLAAPDLLKLLNSNTLPYLIISHLNLDNLILNDRDRKLAFDFFSKALCHVLISYQNLRLIERQLAQSLPNTIVLKNPINLSELSLVPWPHQPTVSFASVARLDAAHKGQDILFETLSLPIWKERDWQCYLYGTGSDQAYLETLARHYGISQRLKFMGHIENIRSIWSNCQLLLMPSRAEGTPLALVEAMLCGRPAVVTDVGDNAKWIEEAQAGFIAEAPTVNSFSAALDRAWLSQSHWKEMGVQAHHYAITQLDNSPGKSLLKLVLKHCESNEMNLYK